MPTRWVQVLILPVKLPIRIHSRQYRYVQSAPLAVSLRSSHGNIVGNFSPLAAFAAVPRRCPSCTCDNSRLSTSSVPCPATPSSPRGSSDKTKHEAARPWSTWTQPSTITLRGIYVAFCFIVFLFLCIQI